MVFGQNLKISTLEKNDSERASQVESFGANFSFIAPSSEELRIWQLNSSTPPPLPSPAISLGWPVVSACVGLAWLEEEDLAETALVVDRLRPEHPWHHSMHPAHGLTLDHTLTERGREHRMMRTFFLKVVAGSFPCFLRFVLYSLRGTIFSCARIFVPYQSCEEVQQLWHHCLLPLGVAVVGFPYEHVGGQHAHTCHQVSQRESQPLLGEGGGG